MIRQLWRRRRFVREHRRTHAQLSEYFDDDLDAADRARVEDHVGRCPECRRVLAGLKAVVVALARLREHAPIDVAPRAIDRLRSEVTTA